MTRLGKAFLAYTLGTLGTIATAAAQDLPTRLAAVRDTTAATAINSTQPTQLNITSNHFGQPKMVGTLLAYGPNGSFIGGTEKVLGGDLVTVTESPRNAAEVREFRAGLVRDPTVSDVNTPASQPGVRITASGMSIDTLTGGIVTAVAPGLETSLKATDYGLVTEHERVQMLLARTLRGVLDSGASAEGIIYKDGASYKMILTAPSGSATLALSGVTYNTIGVPQAGRVDVQSSTLAGDACFAPVVPQGTSRTSEGTCVPLSAGANAQLDLAELAGAASTVPCVRDNRTACLLGGRYEVRVDWQTVNNTGAAKVMSFGGQRTESDQSVFFYFFNAENFEMGIKMVDACVPVFNYKNWAFISGLTNQAYTVTIRDTANGATRTYSNPLGTYPQTIGDTSAFDCQ